MDLDHPDPVDLVSVSIILRLCTKLSNAKFQFGVLYPLIYVHCKNGVLAIDTSFVISFETCLFIDTKSCLYARHVQR